MLTHATKLRTSVYKHECTYVKYIGIHVDIRTYVSKCIILIIVLLN